MHFTTLVPSFLFASLVFSSPTLPLERRATLPCSATGASVPQRTVSSFAKYGVVPTLIPSIRPSVDVKVTYDKPVNLGNEFTVAETTDQPLVAISGIPGPNARDYNYSFFMVDPDVPNPGPGHMPYLHWYVAHVKNQCITNQVNQTVQVYESPSPANTADPTLPNDGEHTYTFLAYLEPPGFQPNPADTATRPGFNVNAYAAANGLKLVGGNFFLEDASNT